MKPFRQLVTSAASLAPLALLPGGLSAAPGAGGLLSGSDSCATPTPISGPGVFGFDSSFATTGSEGQNESLCGSTGIDADVWFVWTADADGAAVLMTCAQTTIDTKVAIYSGAACPVDGSALACNDDTCSVQSAVAWTAVAGQQYLIQLGSAPGTPGGAGTFVIQNDPPPTELAAYSAGIAGDPPTAPAPDTQGWTDIDFSNGIVTVTDVSSDALTGLNAWQVDDTTIAPNTRRYYERAIGPQGVALSRHLGWSLRMKMRMLEGPTETVIFEYSTGMTAADQRYKGWFRVIGDDVRVRIHGTTGPTYLCVGAMDGEYHDFELRKLPGQENTAAEFLYDGVVLGPAPAFTGDALSAPGGVWWGTGSNASSGAANWNELIFRIGEAGVGTAYCFGNGSGTPCPCGNETPSQQGCANSTGAGARLDGTGSSAVGVDDLAFDCTGLLVNQPGLLFAGTNATSGGAGATFGDGLRCAGQGVVRLGVRVPNASGEASWGPNLGASGGWGSGDTRYFQVWYRDPSGSPCGAGFNLSNGYAVSFTP